jgi:hypothetical protein
LRKQDQTHSHDGGEQREWAFHGAIVGNPAKNQSVPSIHGSSLEKLTESFDFYRLISSGSGVLSRSPVLALRLPG